MEAWSNKYDLPQGECLKSKKRRTVGKHQHWENQLHKRSLQNRLWRNNWKNKSQEIGKPRKRSLLKEEVVSRLKYWEVGKVEVYQKTTCFSNRDVVGWPWSLQFLGRIEQKVVCWGVNGRNTLENFKCWWWSAKSEEGWRYRRERTELVERALAQDGGVGIHDGLALDKLFLQG